MPNDYPTKEELETIEKWNIVKDLDNFLEYIEDLWCWSSLFQLAGKKVKRLVLHTGGWSGNEDIIEAMQKNLFWILYWQKSLRGGHYYFKIEPIKDNKC